MDGLSQTSIVGAPYNKIQVGTCVSFAITYFFATIFLALRYVQTVNITKKFELDLVIITIAYGLSLYYFITLIELMRVGWGRHIWELSLSDLMEFNEILLPNTLTYLITPSVTKMSILSVLYLINPSRMYQFTIIAIGICILVYTLTLSIITGGPCAPTKPDTLTCLQNVAISHAVLNIVSDFAVIFTPIPTIHSLQLSLNKRLSVGFILAIGSGVVICSIARLPYVLILKSATDVTYQEGILGIWSLVEINLGILCGCLMRLKKLIVAYLPMLGLGTSLAKHSGSGTKPFGSSVSTGTMGGHHRLRDIEGGTPSPGDHQLRTMQKESMDHPSSRDGGASTEGILTRDAWKD